MLFQCLPPEAHGLPVPARKPNASSPTTQPKTPHAFSFFFAFLPEAMSVFWLKMALSVVKCVSRYNTSGGGGGGVNYLAEVPRRVAQGLYEQHWQRRPAYFEFSPECQLSPKRAVTSHRCSSVLVCRQMWTAV